MGDPLYLPALAESRRISHDEEKALALRIKKGDMDAFAALVMANTRLVISQAKYYRSMPFEDAVAEGLFGLLKAAERYNPSKGTHFATYATWWIQQSMRRARQQYALIRIPAGKFDLTNKLEKIASTLGEKVNAELLAERVSKKGKKYSAAQVQEYMGERHRCNPISLDVLTANVEFGNFQKETPVMDITIGQALRNLTSRERYIIMQSYFTEPPATLNKIGEKVGLTRERVRQVRVKALQKLSKSKSLQQLFKDISDVVE